jgi:hypothetical protein
MHDLQRTKRTDLGTDTAARAVFFNRKVCVDQFQCAFRAD